MVPATEAVAEVWAKVAREALRITMSAKKGSTEFRMAE
jgi:hypothetical protein